MFLVCFEKCMRDDESYLAYMHAFTSTSSLRGNKELNYLCLI